MPGVSLAAKIEDQVSIASILRDDYVIKGKNPGYDVDRFLKDFIALNLKDRDGFSITLGNITQLFHNKNTIKCICNAVINVFFPNNSPLSIKNLSEKNSIKLVERLAISKGMDKRQKLIQEAITDASHRQLSVEKCFLFRGKKTDSKISQKYALEGNPLNFTRFQGLINDDKLIEVADPLLRKVYTTAEAASILRHLSGLSVDEAKQLVKSTLEIQKKFGLEDETAFAFGLVVKERSEAIMEVIYEIMENNKFQLSRKETFALVFEHEELTPEVWLIVFKKAAPLLALVNRKLEANRILETIAEVKMSKIDKVISETLAFSKEKEATSYLAIFLGLKSAERSIVYDSVKPLLDKNLSWDLMERIVQQAANWIREGGDPKVIGFAAPLLAFSGNNKQSINAILKGVNSIPEDYREESADTLAEAMHRYNWRKVPEDFMELYHILKAGKPYLLDLDSLIANVPHHLKQTIPALLELSSKGYAIWLHDTQVYIAKKNIKYPIYALYNTILQINADADARCSIANHFVKLLPLLDAYRLRTLLSLYKDFPLEKLENSLANMRGMLERFGCVTDFVMLAKTCACNLPADMEKFAENYKHNDLYLTKFWKKIYPFTEDAVAILQQDLSSQDPLKIDRALYFIATFGIPSDGDNEPLALLIEEHVNKKEYAYHALMSLLVARVNADKDTQAGCLAKIKEPFINYYGNEYGEVLWNEIKTYKHLVALLKTFEPDRQQLHAMYSGEELQRKEKEWFEDILRMIKE